MQSIKLNTIKTQYRKKNFYSWTSERQPLLVYCASYRLGLACLYNNHGLLTSQMCSSYCLKQRHCRTWNSEGNKLHDRKLDIYKNILMFMVYCLCNFFFFFCFPLHYILPCVSLETSIVHNGFSGAPALIFLMVWFYFWPLSPQYPWLCDASELTSMWP